MKNESGSCKYEKTVIRVVNISFISPFYVLSIVTSLSYILASSSVVA